MPEGARALKFTQKAQGEIPVLLCKGDHTWAMSVTPLRLSFPISKVVKALILYIYMLSYILALVGLRYYV